MISLFTPTHNTKFLPELYKSLLAQTFKDWQWVIVYNNGANPIAAKDPRVKHVILPVASQWVGPLKAYACEQCDGDILVEMDHDDLLTPNALNEVHKAFSAHPDVGFVYSNTIHATGDFQKVQRFDERYGWRYREAKFRKHVLDEHVHFPPTPNCVSRIWFAPNHLRAFRASVYHKVGGYNKNMRILDDLDLMCKLYGVTKFHHIDKGLYVYRIHGENTWLKHNQEIQENVYRIHDQYFENLAETWSRANNLQCVELGGRIAARKGFTTVDLRDADVISDLNGRWPFEDGTVGCVRAFDVFEHLKDSIHTMKELYRILAPGGYAIIQVPSTDGRGAFQDPTHVSFWNQNSFLYYTHQHWNKYIDCPVRFQAIRLYTSEKDPYGVCWTVAHLTKLGDERVPGEVFI
jgi:O-antigen biosynthesis protein